MEIDSSNSSILNGVLPIFSPEINEQQMYVIIKVSTVESGVCSHVIVDIMLAAWKLYMVANCM